MVAGRVIRFDGMRGYGFIAPESGGEDVFLHVNDLLVPESMLRPGLRVEFEIEDGDRGLKASKVRAPEAEGSLVERAGAAAQRGAVADSGGLDGQEPMCDVLSSEELTREVTEMLLISTPDLAGHQILLLREQFMLLGKRHGWVED